MAADLLIESLPQNTTKTSFLAAVRAIEVALLSAGLIYTVLIFKGALVSTSSYDFVSIFRTWLSSPRYICIFIHFVVILIAVSSLFHRQITDSNVDVEDGGSTTTGDDYEDIYDLRSDLSPPAAPPITKNGGTRERIFKSTETTSSEDQDGDHEETNCSVKRVVDEYCHQLAIFADFSRLSEAKEIKKAPTTNAGRKGFRDITTVAEVTDHHHRRRYPTGQAINFTDLPELRDQYSKEIRESHSLGRVKTTQIQIPTNYGETSINMGTNKNQALENELDGDDSDTMEATWRAIMMKRTKAQEKQLQKSETWPKAADDHEERSCKNIIGEAEEDHHNMTSLPEVVLSSSSSSKSNIMTSFNDAVTISCRGGLRRDPSMNLEELNQRVDAFIQKFNREMRLQRHDSDQRHLAMIGGRGLR